MGWTINGEDLTKRRLVTIDGDKVKTLTAPAIGININLPDVKANGADVRLAETDDSPIAREIECTDIPNSDDVMIWFPYDTVESTDSQFYVYWGNAELTEPAEDSTYGKEAVYDSNHKMVHHLKDTTTSTVTDSTSYDNDGTKYAANNPIEANGNYGKIQDFDADEDNINITSNASLDLTDYVSCMGWVYADGNRTVWDTIVSKLAWGIPRKGYSLHFWDENTLVYYSKNVSANATVSLNTWVHAVGVFDKDDTDAELKIYINGSFVDDEVCNGALESSSSDVKIGEMGFANTGNIDGKIDEVRIYDKVLTANEILTIYNNQKNPTNTGTTPFYKTFGDTETYSAGGIITTIMLVD